MNLTNSTSNENPFVPPFIQIDYQVTARCNAKCVFCNCWENRYDESEDLPAKIWIETAKKLSNFTKIEYACIGGGEPMLYRDIFSLIAGLESLGINTTVVTNGSLLSKDNCRRIVETGVTHIDFSIDNFSEKHNQMRGIPSLFEKCVQAMNWLKEIKPEISLGVSTLICENNIDDIPKFTEWVLKNLPVDGINFQAYNQVVTYKGNNWWKNDPLWPKDKNKMIHTLDYLAKKAKEDSRIINDPLQFEKFKKYFLAPDADLNIKCPAGTFNFSVSHKGDIIGCIAQGNVGNINELNLSKLYNKNLLPIRKKASACQENCHFLINCYFPLHWKRWNEIVNDMVGKDSIIAYESGKILLPPEIREITSIDWDDYPALIKYQDHKKLDIIGKYVDKDNRRLPYDPPADIQCIYLCGDTSEIHRWGVDLDENDFFKQIEQLKEFASKKSTYHTIVGVRRTNFHRLDRIYYLILTTRGNKSKTIHGFDIQPFHGIKKRFLNYLDELNELTRNEGIEFRIVDMQLGALLDTIESQEKKDTFDEKVMLRALGPVCKDVFLGPKFILLDLAGRCNLDCTYCRRFSSWNKDYWEGQHPELSGFMDFDLIKNVLHEAKHMDVETVLLVGGGEPTMHPNFSEIIDLIRELGLTFNFSTNAALLDRYNKYLIDGSCHSVTVSLSFASKKTFTKIRPKTDLNTMKKIESNVKELAKLKKTHNTNNPSIIALYAICKDNYKEIVNMTLHAKRLGANTIWYQLVHLEDFSRDKLYIDKKKMTSVKGSLKKAKALCRILGLEFHSFIDFEIKHYDDKKGDWSKEGLLQQGCYVGWNFAFIHLRGEVFLCCGAKAIGILKKPGKGFEKLWHSDAYRRYRNDGLIMHKENPITLYGKPLYDSYCDSCDNHLQNIQMIESIKLFGLEKFVER